jgi:hypothetical protein
LIFLLFVVSKQEKVSGHPRVAMLGQADAGPMALHTQPAQAPSKVIDRHLSFDKSEKKKK